MWGAYENSQKDIKELWPFCFLTDKSEWNQLIKGRNPEKSESDLRKVEYDKLTRKTMERMMYFEKLISWANNIASTHLRNGPNNIILKYVELF